MCSPLPQGLVDFAGAGRVTSLWVLQVARESEFHMGLFWFQWTSKKAIQICSKVYTKLR